MHSGNFRLAFNDAKKCFEYENDNVKVSCGARKKHSSYGPSEGQSHSYRNKYYIFLVFFMFCNKQKLVYSVIFLKCTYIVYLMF